MQQNASIITQVGALSLNNAPQGATGRLRAAPPPNAAAATATSAVPTVTTTPKPAVSAAVVATTAPANAANASATVPDGTVLLSAPLGLQATVLSQPSFYPSMGEDMGDFTEEGDILFPVLGDPWKRVRNCVSNGEKQTLKSDASAATAATAERGKNDEGDNDTNRAGQDADPASAALSGTNANTTNTAVSTRTTNPQPGVTHTSYRLSSSLSSSTALCVQPVLTLPRKVGVSLACEVFRALLCFHNAATYPLAQAHFHIGVSQPPAPQRRALLRRTVLTLPPKSNYTVVAAAPLSEVGTYSLVVSVDYSDPSGRQRNFTWNSTLKTEQPITEVQPRRLACMRPAVPRKPSSTSTSVPSPQWYARYQLILGLQNVSSVPLMMTSAELLLPSLTYHNGRPLFCDLTPLDVALDQGNSIISRNKNDGSTERVLHRRSLSTALLMPGDTQTLVFLIGVYLEELRHATVVHSQGGVTTKLLSTRLTSFGHVQWTWRRANGETGTARSAALRVEQLAAVPDVVLLVTGVVPAALPASSSSRTEEKALAGAARTSTTVSAEETVSHPSMLGEGAPLPQPSHCSVLPPTPQLLLASSPVTIHFTLTNHSSICRYDVVLKIRVEHLAPQWVYTGPTVRRLGALESASNIAFSLTLLPWQTGFLQVVQAALEVVDAQMPETVLWPPSTSSLLQPVQGKDAGNTSSNLNTAADNKNTDGRPALVATLPEVAQTAMKAALPVDGDVLCEVLVL